MISALGRFFAGLICFLGAPLHLCLSALIKQADGGPALYICRRIGRICISFNLLKYRTMHVNASEIITEGFKTIVTQTDPRVTRLGAWLRCGLDELPQLWNIVRGEMAWVGPRPDEAWMAPNYGPVCRRRVSVAPGITGLAQVLHSRNLSTAEGYAIDVWYIAHRSFWLDLWIIAVTPLFMAGWRSVGNRRLQNLRSLKEFDDLHAVCNAELTDVERASFASERTAAVS
jgi:undecaprenyl phosphate N,N'-diacetylbacillosamine 1-phosphate transferase